MAKLTSKSNIEKVKTGALYAIGAALFTAAWSYAQGWWKSRQASA